MPPAEVTLARGPNFKLRTTKGKNQKKNPKLKNQQK
jgi:hypothetical protein